MKPDKIAFIVNNKRTLLMGEEILINFKTFSPQKMKEPF